MASICAELPLNGCELIYEGPMVLTEVLFHPHTSVSFVLTVKKKSICVCSISNIFNRYGFGLY